LLLPCMARPGGMANLAAWAGVWAALAGRAAWGGRRRPAGCAPWILAG
jgi:hypothetical protein